MAQTIPRGQVLGALQRRYDYQSAQVVLKRALTAVNLTEQEQYSSDDLVKIGKGLQKVGDRVDSVLAQLSALAGAPGPADKASVVSVEPPAIPGLTARRAEEVSAPRAVETHVATRPVAEAASADASEETSASA